jgi:hypothetical protein
MADSKSLILGSAQDLYLTRDAANVLAQRNGVSAQTFNIYNTYTDASNYERGFLKWNSNVFEIGAEEAGTGTARNLAIRMTGKSSGKKVSFLADDGTEMAYINDYGAFVGSTLYANNSTDYNFGSISSRSIIRGPSGVWLQASQDISSGNVFTLYSGAGDEITASSGTQNWLFVEANINQSGTAGYTGILLDVIETATGSGATNLLDLQVGSTSQFKVANDGVTTIDAVGHTVAGLPGTPAVGMIARVTDALTPSLGATVTGGGAEDALVWYDGAAWVVVSGESGIGGGGGLANVVEDTTPQLGGQLDVNGQSLGDGTLELLSFSETASAVNEFTIANAATGNGPTLSATGSDTDVPINITPKGAGAIRLNGKTAYPFGGAISLTGGVTTVTDSYHEVTSQSGPSDDLDTLNGGVDGMIVILHPTSGDTITVKDGTGNIKTATDFAMNAIEDSIMLIYSSAQSAWIEISRSDNG